MQVGVGKSEHVVPCASSGLCLFLGIPQVWLGSLYDKGPWASPFSPCSSRTVGRLGVCLPLITRPSLTPLTSSHSDTVLDAQPVPH